MTKPPEEGLRENPIEALRAPLLEGVGGYADEGWHRIVEELIDRIARLPGMDDSYGREKVTSLRSFAAILFSARRHRAYGSDGAQTVRSHMLSDLARVEMHVPEERRLVPVSCEHRSVASGGVVDRCYRIAAKRVAGRALCWLHADP